MRDIREVLIEIAYYTSTRTRTPSESLGHINLATDSGQFFRNTHEGAIKAAFHLPVYSSQENFSEQIMQVLKVFLPDTFGTVAIDRPKSVCKHYIHVLDNNWAFGHAIELRSFSVQVLAVSGSSNQYSSMSGISSSSTTECSHAVIVSVDSLSSGDFDKKLCPTANPEPRPGSSEMV